MKTVNTDNVEKPISEQDNLVIDKTIANLQGRLDKFWISLNSNFGSSKARFLVENAPRFVVENSWFMQDIINTTSHPDDVNFLDLWYSNNLTARLSKNTWARALFETLGVKSIKLKPLIHNGQKIQWLPLNKKFVIDRNYLDKMSDDIKLFIANNKDKNVSDLVINLCEDKNLKPRLKYKITKAMVASVFWLNGDFDNPKTKIINSDFIKYIYGQILWYNKLPNRLSEYMINNIQNIIRYVSRQLIDINLENMTKWQKEQIIYMNIKHWLIDYINQNNPEIASIFDDIWLNVGGKLDISINTKSDNYNNIYKSFANIINDEEFGGEFVDYLVRYALDKKWWNPVELWITNDGGIIYIYPSMDDYKIIKQTKWTNIYIWKWLEDAKYILTWLGGNSMAWLSGLQITQFTNVFDSMHSMLNGSIAIWSERWMRGIVLSILEGYFDFKWIGTRYSQYIQFIKDIKINGDNSLRDWVANIDTDGDWLYPSFNNRFPDSLYMCLLWPKLIWTAEFTRSYMNAEIPFDISSQKQKLIEIFEVPKEVNKKIIELAEIC